jgi:hypothetical protein
MKTRFLYQIMPLLLAFALPWTTRSQSGPTNQASGASPAPKPRSEVTTNGITGEVHAFLEGGHQRLPTIQVFVNEPPGISGGITWPPGRKKTKEEWDRMAAEGARAFGEKGQGAKWREVLNRRGPNNEWLYYMATNSFCGPVEVRNTSGRKLPSLKPQFCAFEAYRTSYSFSAATVQLRPPPGYSGSPLPKGLGGARPELARFELGDYFEITEPGEYTLTVWPKIYKRAPGPGDLCERVDIPPVSLKLKWGGTVPK